jgi:hypothetical protein
VTRASTFQEGHLIVGRYEVVKTIFGGMGEVVICIDVHDSDLTKVVLKTYFDELLEDTLRQRFKLEAEAWLRLGSPEYSYYAGLKRLLKVEGKL